ncbi:UNVERIFIED_CONTAM: hypothetical protein Sangu_3124000 [Sesamum angustifolium]|uniref:Uncharacterized protein n=1 Tax=Sesamum angustifolium TaxID=2727405 RepID=A0AAW2K0X7_9LAMI
MECSISKGMTPANITANVNTIPMLNGSNFKLLKENLEIVLGVTDLDLVLSEYSPPALTDKSTSEQKREKERWEKSNQVVKNEKAEIGTLLTNLISKSQFKVSYNCQKETWSLNELISHCVQEEERLKQDKTECAYFTSTSKGKDKGKKRKKDNEAADTAPQKKQQKNQIIQRLYVTSVRLKGILRNTASTFTHGVLRKVCLSCQKPNDVERYIYVGDGKAVLVEAI